MPGKKQALSLPSFPFEHLPVAGCHYCSVKLSPGSLVRSIILILSLVHLLSPTGSGQLFSMCTIIRWPKCWIIFPLQVLSSSTFTRLSYVCCRTFTWAIVNRHPSCNGSNPLPCSNGRHFTWQQIGIFCSLPLLLASLPSTGIMSVIWRSSTSIMGTKMLTGQTSVQIFFSSSSKAITLIFFFAAASRYHMKVNITIGSWTFIQPHMSSCSSLFLCHACRSGRVGSLAVVVIHADPEGRRSMFSRTC